MVHSLSNSVLFTSTPPPLTLPYSLLQSCAPVCVCMWVWVWCAGPFSLKFCLVYFNPPSPYPPLLLVTVLCTCVCVHVGVGVVCWSILSQILSCLLQPPPPPLPSLTPCYSPVHLCVCACGCGVLVHSLSNSVLFTSTPPSPYPPLLLVTVLCTCVCVHVGVGVVCWSILSQILSCLLQPPPPLTLPYSLLQSCAPVCVCMWVWVWCAGPFSLKFCLVYFNPPSPYPPLLLVTVLCACVCVHAFGCVCVCVCMWVWVWCAGPFSLKFCLVYFNPPLPLPSLTPCYSPVHLCVHACVWVCVCVCACGCGVLGIQYYDYIIIIFEVLCICFS